MEIIDKMFEESPFSMFPEPGKTKLRMFFSTLVVKLYEFKTKELSGLLEPLQLLEIMHELFQIADDNKLRPIAINEYLERKKFNLPQTILILEHFQFMLNEGQSQGIDFTVINIYVESEINRRRLVSEKVPINKTHLIPQKEKAETKNKSIGGAHSIENKDISNLSDFVLLCYYEELKIKNLTEANAYVDKIGLAPKLGATFYGYYCVHNKTKKRLVLNGTKRQIGNRIIKIERVKKYLVKQDHVDHAQRDIDSLRGRISS